tara:strand:- start:5 stop:1513 length:1509 start_codon:yes stop_codon:yes gene_type:complete
MSYRSKLYPSQQLRQEMKSNPRLYQAMELLHMPLFKLQQHLKQELAENPFLEMTESDDEREVELKESPSPAEEKDTPEGVDWEDILLDGFDAGGRRPQYEEREFFQPADVESRDLRTHLEEQLRLLDLSERELRLGEEIVGNIDDDGMLSCTLEGVVTGANDWLDEVRKLAEERAEVLGLEDRSRELEDIGKLFGPYSLEEAEQMLARVQQFEPAGVAARDLRECILLQMCQSDLGGSLARQIVLEHFDEFINHRWSDIAESMGIGPSDVQDAADQISQLEPKPGLKYAPPQEQYITPDLIVDKVSGEYQVFVNDIGLPRLRLSRAYREIARDKNKFKGENKEFIYAKINSANWMIQAIEQRRQTMLKVMNFIVIQQRDFFEKGVQYLKPLTLQEVAKHIDMHMSTVSRVTNEKFCQTPSGVYSLKFFFSSGLSTTSGNEISARGVKDKIQNLVGSENPSSPLTDQAIVNMLKSDGVKIARRTVAKYRDELGILPARSRKRV